MRIKKAAGKVFGASLSKAEERAMNMEIQRQLAEYTKKHYLEVDALILWFLHEQFGFGEKRLRRVFFGLNDSIKELCNRYEMHEQNDDVWLSTNMLKRAGIDIEKWEKEVENNAE